MRFAYTDDQVLFAEAVRDLLAKACPPEVVRAAWPEPDPSAGATGAGHGARASADDVGRVWQSLVEMGVPGLVVPEAAGGLGFDEVAAVAVLTEVGYAAPPFPVTEHLLVVAPLLAAAGEAGAELLGSLLDGSAIATAEPFTGAPVAGGRWATVAATFDPDGAVARVGRLDDDGRDLVDGVDGGRGLARVLTRSDVLEVVDAAAIARAWRGGALGTAAELVGLGRRMLDLTVAYVAERKQFGVPIGSFQAVKHHLADARLALEFAEPAVMAAAWSVASGEVGRDDEVARSVSLAKALASEAALRVGRAALQCHGAIGYTVEYDLHLHLKRSWALARAWGDAAWHRNEIARTLGI